MTAWQMYFITVCDGLKNLFAYSSIVIGMASIGMIIFLVTEDYESTEPMVKFIKKLLKIDLIVLAIFGFAAILIPTSKQLTTIVVIPKIANAERLDNVKPEFYDTALSWMKEIENKKE